MKDQGQQLTGLEQQLEDKKRQLEDYTDQERRLQQEVVSYKVKTTNLQQEVVLYKATKAIYKSALRVPTGCDINDEVRSVLYDMVREVELQSATISKMADPDFRKRVQTIVPFYGTPWGFGSLAKHDMNNDMYMSCIAKVREFAYGLITEDDLRKHNPYEQGPRAIAANCTQAAKRPRR